MHIIDKNELKLSAQTQQHWWNRLHNIL